MAAEDQSDKSENPAQDAPEMQENQTGDQAQQSADVDIGDDVQPLVADGDEDLAAQVAQMKDQLLRQLAEVENIKRRASRDVENAHKFASEKLLNDLFPVLDSLEKAVETAAATTGAQAIAEGVELSLKLFVDTLQKNGVEQIDPLGEPFDPAVHEAMTMVPNPDAEPNSVMDVMAKGYVLNGRLVRAAKVIVVKGE